MPSLFPISGMVRMTVALGRPTSQSSTHENGVSSKAVDGSHTDGKFTHTTWEYNAWWSVTLGGKYKISKIKSMF